MTSLIGLVGTICLLGQSTYTIYPIPQEQTILEGKARTTHQVKIIADQSIDSATTNRALSLLHEAGFTPVIEPKGSPDAFCVYLSSLSKGGRGSHQLAEDHLDADWFKSPLYDKHIVRISPSKSGVAKVQIIGENTEAVFYGLASLEQILEQATTHLQSVLIRDGAHLQDRGVVEGFYGEPYTMEETKELMRFMMRYKMNCYLYGAKGDAYHSHFWQAPYPLQITPEQQAIGYLSQDMIEEITQMAQATKVRFVWAIHPGQDFIAPSDSVVGLIMNKFKQMHHLGVRSFAVFTDDVGVPSKPELLARNARRITQLQESMDRQWTHPEDSVSPLLFVPQLYAYSWVSSDVRKRFFQALSHTPGKVQIFITGANVWSVPNNIDLETVSEDLGRNPSWWWNYPCNDNADTQLFATDMYANFKAMPEIHSQATLPSRLQGARSLLSNPMQQATLSQIALFSIADYAWNNSAFNYAASYRAAINSMVGPEKAQGFADLLSHFSSADSIQMAPLIQAYEIEGDMKPLLGKLRELSAALIQVEQLSNASNTRHRMLYQDIAPWVQKLKAMVHLTELILLQDDFSAQEWEHITLLYNNLSDLPDFSVAVLEGMGGAIELKTYNVAVSPNALRPFIERLYQARLKKQK